MNNTGILLLYQQRWGRDKSKVRVWEKSRRIGASWYCACESVLAAAPERGAVDTWYIAYSKEMTQEFMRDCAHWVVSLSAAASDIEECVVKDEDKDILAYRITFASGKRITALSSRPTSLRGKQGRIIIDEAAFHDDLTGLVKSAMATIMWGGRVDILSTHNGVDSSFNKIVENIRAKRLKYSLHRTTLDDAIREGLFRRICLVTGGEWSPKLQATWRQDLIDYYGDGADEELFCIPSRSGVGYLSRDVIEQCMYPAPVLRFESPAGFVAMDDELRHSIMQDWIVAELDPVLRLLNRDLWHALGEDFGRTSDLTVLAPVATNQNLTRTVPFLAELRNVPFREQEQVMVHLVDHLPRFQYAAFDAGGNGQYLAERAWQRYGENRVEMIGLTEKWYGENLPPFRADLEDRLMAIPRDADVLSDLQAFQIIDGVPRMPKVRKTQKAGTRTKGVKRHGDAGIALALGHYASRMEIRHYAYESVEGSRARKGL